MLEFLPVRVLAAIQNVNLNLLYEIRMRSGKPTRVNFNGAFTFLGEYGLSNAKEHALCCTAQEIEETLFAASGYSVYSVEEQLKSGFLTGKAGERIGIAGTVVYEKQGVLSVHSVTSLCIRIPHEIKGCALQIFTRCFQRGLCSVLILSPPGEGKTTILRDLTRLISESTLCNVLVGDERGELSAGDLGPTSDVVRYADKLTAFTAGIRAMRPDMIVTDELLPHDYAAVKRAIESGVCVLASAHLTRVEDVAERLFDYYVILNGLGRVSKICNREGEYVA